jgi:DNA modification methylase
MIELIQGDCLQEMQNIESYSIDFILTDLPYGTTACSWDEIIPFEPMWKEFYRILRPNGFIALTASQPFTTKLIASNFDNFSHQWIWEKVGSNGNPLLANVMPLKNFEDVLLFSNEPTKHDTKGEHPQRKYFKKVMDYIGLNLKQINTKLGHRRAEHTFYIDSTQYGLCTEKTYLELIEVFGIDKMTGFIEWSVLDVENKAFRIEHIRKFDEKYPRVYNPQMTKGEPYKLKQGSIGEAFGGTKKDDIVTENNGERYPKSILSFGYCKDKLHPTQKPVELMEYLIKTYTNEGMTVFDATMGSGTTIIACQNTKRNGIGIELDNSIFALAKKRVEEKRKEKDNEAPTLFSDPN